MKISIKLAIVSRGRKNVSRQRTFAAHLHALEMSDILMKSDFNRIPSNIACASVGEKA